MTLATLYRSAFLEYIRHGTPIPLEVKSAWHNRNRTSRFYEWRTRGDGRVRSSHRENDGQVFSWDNPPPTGHPGEDYGCRCRAIPVSDDDYRIPAHERITPVGYHEDHIDGIVHDEGDVEHMYLDSRGLVTVGRGKLLSTVSDALRIPFVNSSGQPASSSEIRADYNALVSERNRQRSQERKPFNYRASYYRQFTSLVISDDTSQKLVEDHVDDDLGHLRNIFPNFDSFPEPAQRALLDMIYNLGPTRLRRYPSMIAAINRGDWERAAEESNRRGISDARNQQTADRFREAGGISTDHSLAPSSSLRPQLRPNKF